MQPPGIQDLHAKEKRFAFSVCGDLQYQTGKSLLPSAGEGWSLKIAIPK